MLWRLLEEHPPSRVVAIVAILLVVVAAPPAILAAFAAGMAVMKLGLWLDTYGVRRR